MLPPAPVRLLVPRRHEPVPPPMKQPSRRLLSLRVATVAALVSLVNVSSVCAAPARTEYRGSDSRNFYRMVLDVHQDPQSKVVIIDGGRIEFASLAQPYQIQQAAGKKVPKLGANQLAGVVLFSQANIGITATLFTGNLTGDIASGTINVSNVRFQAYGRTEDLNLTLRPVGMSGPSPAPSSGSGSGAPLAPKPVILPPGVANNIAHGRSGVSPSAPPIPPPPVTANVGNAPVRLMDNSNTGGVTQTSNPKRPSFFIYTPARVTEIWTYHWNNGRGSAPGTISLMGSNGVTYGPWKAAGSAGSGNAPNVNWTVHPNVVIPAGTYTVVDSSPSTWSINTQSHDVGFARVDGTH